MNRTRVFFTVFFIVLLATLFACSRNEQAQTEPERQAPPAQQAEQVPEPAQEPAPHYEAEPAPAVQGQQQRSAPARQAPAQQPSRTRSETQPSNQPPAEPVDTAPAQGAQRDPVVVPSTPRPAQDPAGSAVYTPPPPPRRTTATVTEGTTLEIRLTDAVSTATNQTGDRFQAVLDKDIVADGRVVAPRGSTVVGRLTEVVRSGKVQGRAIMSLTLNEIRTTNNSYPIATNTITIEAQDTKERDAKTVGAGAGVGAVIGAIAGGKKGAAIGAAVGGGAGTAGVLLTRGKEVEFDPEQKFSFRLERDTEMRLP
jgi:hypothetical protein